MYVIKRLKYVLGVPLIISIVVLALESHTEDIACANMAIQSQYD